MTALNVVRAAVVSALFGFCACAVHADEVRLDVNGRSWHASKPPAWPAHDWNQNNAGIGLQYVTKADDEGWRSRFTAGTMRDSLGVNGEYTGAGRDYAWESESFKWSAGWMVMVMNRTLSFNQPNKRLYVAPLPVASLEHKASGVGVNAVFVPEVSLNGQKLPSTLFLSLSYKIDSY